MHWTLDEVLGLPADLYGELVAWINETHSADPDELG